MRIRVAVASCAAVAVAFVGVRVVAGNDHPTDETATSEPQGPGSTAGSTPGPTVDELGVLHGWERNREGARAAAVQAVRLTGSIVRAGFITRADMIESLSSEAYGPTLAGESARQLNEVGGDLGAASVPHSEITWSEIPLTARVVAADDWSALIEVWSVLVLGVPDIGAPRQAWRTVEVALVWERDDWRIDGWSAAAGPTPMLDAMSAIASYDDVVEVLSWPTPEATR